MILVGIYIENFLSITSLMIKLNDGLTVISGESGAGKSTIVDAICWCLGLQSNRTKNLQLALVKLTFSNDIEITRSSNNCGNSTFKINDNRVTKRHIDSIISSLITICRQDNRLTFSLDDDLINSIDSKIHDQNLLKNLKNSFLEWQCINKTLENLHNSHFEDLDYIQQVVQEIDELKLNGNDEEELVLQRREQIELFKSYESLQKAQNILFQNNESSSISMQLIALAKHLNSNNPRIRELQTRVENILNEIDDIKESVQDIIYNSESNEVILNTIDERLTKIRSIAKKYRITSSELLKFAEHYKEKINIMINLDTERKKYVQKLSAAEQKLNYISNQINNLREGICTIFNCDLVNILNEISMSHISCQLKIIQVDHWSATGNIQVKLHINDNRILSGGEMSRLLLAIKIATADLNIPIIFDEIDIGIGGATAHKIGSTLNNLSVLGQVIVVTHQAQVAAHGKHHILVKQEQSSTHCYTLTFTERIQEIARMISGNTTTNESLLAARKLIDECHKRN